ncbi:hypothetical protein [Ensifer sp.]|jgi:hypothetical protein|uniref:hypothetical protein n=1 Tax=Ensifer sp. TaxID=1872086 RepID=UPI002E13360B|nr:hypothetical protein [Ensifer sp.]
MAKHPKFISPKRTGAYPQRDLDCQLAIADVFQTVAEYAEASGWPEHEVADALIELAHNHRIALEARDRMSAQMGMTTRNAKLN